MAFLILPAHLRLELKKPMGNLVGNIKELDIKADTTIICVGDKTTEEVLKARIKPKICVYDGKIERKKIQIPQIIEDYDAEEIGLKNPPGSLNTKAFELIEKALNSEKNLKIKVDGEEDLITLAAVDRAPMDSLVVYGQPGEGVVVVNVNEKTKNRVKAMLKEM